LSCSQYHIIFGRCMACQISLDTFLQIFEVHEFKPVAIFLQ
jgi:hypothetical protein